MTFLLHNLGYVGLLVLSAGMLVWPEIDRILNGGGAVGATEATLLMNQQRALVLDLRAPDEFQRGHVPGARNLPASELAGRVGELAKAKGRPLVLVGDRPAGAMRVLRAAGFTSVVQLRGGMATWREAGMPTQKG